MNLHDCEAIADDCSSCTRSRETLDDFKCGWCGAESRCVLRSECSEGTILTDPLQCADHTITSFTPLSGPPEGGTIIIIHGTELGASLEDFDGPNSIRVGDEPCTPLEMDYVPGEKVVCETSNGLSVGAHDVVVTLARSAGLVPVFASDRFVVVQPTLRSVEPMFGPIAGGTQLTVRGSGLDIGSSVNVTVDGTECSVK